MNALELSKILLKNPKMIVVKYDPIINAFMEIEDDDIMEVLLTKDPSSGLLQPANLHADDEEHIICLNL